MARCWVSAAARPDGRLSGQRNHGRGRAVIAAELIRRESSPCFDDVLLSFRPSGALRRRRLAVRSSIRVGGDVCRAISGSTSVDRRRHHHRRGDLRDSAIVARIVRPGARSQGRATTYSGEVERVRRGASYWSSFFPMRVPLIRRLHLPRLGYVTIAIALLGLSPIAPISPPFRTTGRDDLGGASGSFGAKSVY